MASYVPQSFFIKKTFLTKFSRFPLWLIKASWNKKKWVIDPLSHSMTEIQTHFGNKPTNWVWQTGEQLWHTRHAFLFSFDKDPVHMAITNTTHIFCSLKAPTIFPSFFFPIKAVSINLRAWMRSLKQRKNATTNGMFPGTLTNWAPPLHEQDRQGETERMTEIHKDRERRKRREGGERENSLMVPILILHVVYFPF